MKTTWQTKKLSEVISVFADGDWIEKKDQSRDGIRLIQTGNIGNGYFKDRGEKARYISDKTFHRLNCTEIVPGDCLVSRLPDPVGRSCLLPNTNEKMITAVDCTIIRFKNEILPQWFVDYSLSNEYQNQINKEVGGATRQRISRANLGHIEIPLPEISEQKRIVKKLDEVFEKVTKAKEAVEKNLQNAKELFESYLNNVFANPGKDWEEKELGELYQVGSSKRVLKSQWRKEGVPFYRGREITRLATDGYVNNELFISEEHYERLLKQSGVPKTGDIVITAIGTIGNLHIVRENDRFYFKDASVLWLKRITDIDSEFIKFWFKSAAFFNQLEKGNGATVDTLTIKKLQSVHLLLPSLKEQKQIVEKLKKLSAETKKLEKIYEQKLADFEELKKSILSKAFRAEL